MWWVVAGGTLKRFLFPPPTLLAEIRPSSSFWCMILAISIPPCWRATRTPPTAIWLLLILLRATIPPSLCCIYITTLSATSASPRLCRRHLTFSLFLCPRQPWFSSPHPCLGLVLVIYLCFSLRCSCWLWQEGVFEMNMPSVLQMDIPHRGFRPMALSRRTTPTRTRMTGFEA